MAKAKFRKHELAYVQTGTWQNMAKVTKDGNIQVVWEVSEHLDVTETSLWCEECGIPIRSYEEYEDHGISEDWQAL